MSARCACCMIRAVRRDWRSRCTIFVCWAPRRLGRWRFRRRSGPRRRGASRELSDAEELLRRNKIVAEFLEKTNELGAFRHRQADIGVARKGDVGGVQFGQCSRRQRGNSISTPPPQRSRARVFPLVFGSRRIAIARPARAFDGAGRGGAAILDGARSARGSSRCCGGRLHHLQRDAFR